MTSTSFNVGLTDNTRLSSRVLRPPGGGHTDIFGGEPEAPAPRRQPPAAGSAIAAVVAQDEPKPTNGTDASPSQNGPQTAPEPAPQAPAPQAPAPQAPTPVTPPEPKQTSPFNPEPKKTSPFNAEPPKADPPKRVRVPPGGFSSGLW